MYRNKLELMKKVNDICKNVVTVVHVVKLGTSG